MNKNFRFFSAALALVLALALLAGCQSAAPSQPAETPQAPAAPAETSPDVSPAPEEADAGSIQFKPGTYLCGDIYFTFYTDGASGSTTGKDSGIGVGFAYEVEGGQVTFHMGSIDDSTVATVTAVDENTFDVKWAGGRQETMTYVPDYIPDVTP